MDAMMTEIDLFLLPVFALIELLDSIVLKLISNLDAKRVLYDCGLDHRNLDLGTLEFCSF